MEERVRGRPSRRVRHLQKLQYTDLLLGELLDQMEASGTWDDTMLVVVADHGISFTAHQEPRYVSPDNEAADDVVTAVHQGSRVSRAAS